MLIESKMGKYSIIRPLTLGEWANHYLVTDEGGIARILMIARRPIDNGKVDSTFVALEKLLEKSDEFEQIYSETSDRKLHYDWLFPTVLDRFSIPSQADRKALVLEYRDANPRVFFPLVQILNQNQRLDFKTSAWILGRFLKLEDFFELTDEKRPFYRPFVQQNILIDPENHRMMPLDWSRITRRKTRDQLETNLHKEVAFIEELINAKSFYTLETPEGDFRKYRAYSASLAEADKGYLELLKLCHWLIDGLDITNDPGGRTRLTFDPESIHRKFYHGYRCDGLNYEGLDDLYGREFHPFTTLPR